MLKYLIIAACALISVGAHAQLPDSVCVSGQQMHVQGLAFDKGASQVYFSFTDRFLKTDYSGSILGSIDRIEGHLGAMTFDEESGLVYASLECKDDEIGAGIAKKHGTQTVSKGASMFYIAVIDPKTMTYDRFPVKEAVEDYNAPGHRFGCSGIDGVAIAPAPGKMKGKRYLYIAYGIYSDTLRTDNDYQVLLQYDMRSRRCVKRYFVYTGNTNYGVQNMAYDRQTGRLLLAAYKGKKRGFPNYTLFSVDMTRRPEKKKLAGAEAEGRQWQLKTNGGWHFGAASTGVCSVGEGIWYVSESYKDKQTKLYGTVARPYKWLGSEKKPFGER